MGCLFCSPSPRLGTGVRCLVYGSDLFWADKTRWSGYTLDSYLHRMFLKSNPSKFVTLNFSLVLSFLLEESMEA